MHKTLIHNLKDEIFIKQNSYFDVFNTYAQSHEHMNCNMFYGKKEIVNNYCSWLFPILSNIDKNYYTQTGDFYNNRELGYLSELLFGIWLDKNDIKYRTVDAINIDNSFDKDVCLNMFDFIAFLFKNAVSIIKRR